MTYTTNVTAKGNATEPYQRVLESRLRRINEDFLLKDKSDVSARAAAAASFAVLRSIRTHEYRSLVEEFEVTPPREPADFRGRSSLPKCAELLGDRLRFAPPAGRRCGRRER